MCFSFFEKNVILELKNARRSRFETNNVIIITMALPRWVTTQSQRAALSPSGGHSGSSQSWPVTRSPWRWCLCMTPWGWRPWSTSSTWVRQQTHTHKQTYAILFCVRGCIRNTTPIFLYSPLSVPSSKVRKATQQLPISLILSGFLNSFIVEWKLLDFKL